MLRSLIFKTGFASFVTFALLISACKNGADKLAEINGSTIDRADIEKAGGKALADLREQIYRMEKQKLDELIQKKLLAEEAKRRNISVATLLEQEVEAKVPPVTEKEIEALYKNNKARIPVQLDEVREKIKDFLKSQRIDAQKAHYVKSLIDKAKITSYLKQPALFRLDLAVHGAPSKGSQAAPVTLVKFEDFHCPFCKQVQPTLAQLLAQYDGKLRLVHKDLPLDGIHPQARQAAEAARCADEQGKFWSYHDKLYDSAPKAAAVDLKSYAKQVGLDLGAFERCFSSGKYKGMVQKDVLEGARAGITGTPAFFVNGRAISGAQPVEAFAAIIDEELARQK